MVPDDHDRRQELARATVDELVAAGGEVGVQVAVVEKGRTVIDVVAGVADAATGAPVGHDTLFHAASAAKGVASALAHVLIERGLLADDMRVVDVWPELGVHGKDRLTLRHVLCHTAGLPGLPAGTTVEDLCDLDEIGAVLADSVPWWEPGTRFGYHALTFGVLVGEIMRRAAGRSLARLLRDEITGPLGIEDEVLFGVPRRLLPRVARQVATDGPAPAPPEPGSPLARAIPPGVRPGADFANRVDVLTADVGSWGTMTARGAARFYAALLGHVDGVELVSPQRRALMASIVYTGMDEVMGFPTEWAYGFSPARPGGVPTRPGSVFGMVGMNGSAAYADIDAGVAVAVMRNRYAPGDLSAAARIDRLVAHLGSPASAPGPQADETAAPPDGPRRRDGGPA